MLFDTIDRVVQLMRNASTTTGLRTTVNVIRREYQNKRNATDEIKEDLRTIFDSYLPKWNYITKPMFGH